MRVGVIAGVKGSAHLLPDPLCQPPVPFSQRSQRPPSCQGQELGSQADLGSRAGAVALTSPSLHWDLSLPYIEWGE